VALPAAAPANDAEVDDVAAAFVSLEYVYLFRVVCGFGPQQEQTAPNAKIPTVALPVAAPPYVASLAAVADALVQPEYVYLLRVVEMTPPALPKAKIPTVELPAADPLHVPALDAVATALVQPEYVNLLRIVYNCPTAKIPTVELPAADPAHDAMLAAAADAFTSPEYVYLLRVVEAPAVFPKAKIPRVELPAADCLFAAAVDAVAAALVHPENVYLLRVVVRLVELVLYPIAKIAKVPTAFPAVGHSPAFCQVSIWSIVHMPGAVLHTYGPEGTTGVFVIKPPGYVLLIPVAPNHRLYYQLTETHLLSLPKTICLPLSLQ
jgi:hypothetical protein